MFHVVDLLYVSFIGEVLVPLDSMITATEVLSQVRGKFFAQILQKCESTNVCEVFIKAVTDHPLFEQEGRLSG